MQEATATVEAWAQAGSYLTWRGYRVFVREDGAGEPLLLLHGIPTASWDWHAIWPELAARYRVLAPDLIGFGLSAKPRDFPYGVASQADLCEALLAERQIQRVHLLCQDDGDTIAQELLARTQEPSDGLAIASVCFLNGGIFPEAHRPLLMQRLIGTRLGRPLARLVMRRPFQRSLSRLFGPHTQPDQATLDVLWELLVRNGGKAIMPRLMGYRADRQQHRERRVGALVRAGIPRCFICGTGDPVCATAMIERWRDLVPDGDLIELPGIGHWPQIEAPDAVLRAYLEFRDKYRI